MMLYLEAALLAFAVVRESRSFITAQVMGAVASSCRSTKRSTPRMVAHEVAAFHTIVRRGRFKYAYGAAIFSCFLLPFPRTLFAQANASGLSLNVKDQQGLAIVDAKVDIRQDAYRSSRLWTSDPSQGVFSRSESGPVPQIQKTVKVQAKCNLLLFGSTHVYSKSGRAAGPWTQCSQAH
jgi:hypothetical protein